MTTLAACPRPLGEEFFARDTLDVARGLLGCTLLRDGCGGVIVEVEAYTDDAASHFVTRPRTGAIMGAGHGRVYVYSIYGMHRCLNFTTDARGPGAVLVRALEPTRGIDEMLARRAVDRLEALCSGPAKVAQALGVDVSDSGRAAGDVVTLLDRDRAPEIASGPRIGISKARELPWRFWVAGSRFVSR